MTRETPGPRGRFLVGNVDIPKNFLGSMERLQREFGDIVKCRIGPVRIVVISHPDLVEELLSTKAARFRKSDGENMIRPATGNGLFLSEGDFWKRQRRMMSPPFHMKAVASYADTMVEVADRVTRDFTDGETRDLFADTTRIGLNVVARTLFDSDVDGDAAEVGALMTAMVEAVSARLKATLPLAPWVPTPTNLKLRRAVKRLDRVVYRFIAERRARPTGKLDLLSLLLAARDEDGSTMTDQQVRDEAMTLFVAGFETTAITLAWTLALIAANPAIARKLESEIDAALGARAPSAADLPRLKYVESVVNEALRLYPPAWGVSRRALEDVELGGRLVRKDTEVIAPTWLLHRDPRFWKSPASFDPERWLGGEKPSRYVFLPFGAGARICIGNQMAMMESTLVIARVIQKFSLEAIGPLPAPEAGFTLRPSGGVLMRVHRRETARAVA